MQIAVVHETYEFWTQLRSDTLADPEKRAAAYWRGEASETGEREILAEGRVTVLEQFPYPPAQVGNKPSRDPLNPLQGTQHPARLGLQGVPGGITPGSSIPRC